MVEAIARYTCNACGAVADASLDRLPLFWIKVQTTGRGSDDPHTMTDRYAHICPTCAKLVRDAVPEGATLAKQPGDT